METSETPATPDPSLSPVTGTAADALQPQETAAPAGYEFTADQSQIVEGLSATMRAVGLFMLLAGVALVVLGLAEFLRRTMGHVGSGFVFLLQGALNLFLGIWTRSAGDYFHRAAATEGADVENLMGALGELRRIYGLQLTLIVVSLVVLAVAATVSLGAWFMMYGRGG